VEEMTQEEKEREAEKLFVLFERFVSIMPLSVLVGSVLMILF
jgi:hypothetical protein